MSLLVAQHQFSTLERVLKIWYFSQNKYASCFWQKLCGFNHKRLTYVITISLVILVEFPQVAMDVSICNTDPTSCDEKEHNIWYFVWILRVVVGIYDMVLTTRGLYIPSESSFNHRYTIGGCYETIEQHWMSLLVAHHPISFVERVPKIWYGDVWNVRVVFGRNDMVLTIRGSDMLLKALHYRYTIEEGSETLQQQYI